MDKYQLTISFETDIYVFSVPRDHVFVWEGGSAYHETIF